MKEMDILLSDQFQTQFCFETAPTVWVSKYFCPQKIFFLFVNFISAPNELFKYSSKSSVQYIFIYFYSTTMLGYKYASLNTAPKLRNSNIQLLIVISRVSAFPSGSLAFEIKICKHSYTSILHVERSLVSKIIIIFVSWKFSEMGAGTEKGQTGLDYDHKILMEVRVYVQQEIQSNIYHDQTNRLQQTLANISFFIHIKVCIQYIAYG